MTVEVKHFFIKKIILFTFRMKDGIIKGGEGNSFFQSPAPVRYTRFVTSKSCVAI